VGGERRTSGGDVKFCISNPGLRQLVVAHAQREMRARPGRDSISMDPSDGGNWCECEPCAEMGSVSDRVLALANEVAVAINKLGLGSKYVGILAYNEHSPPPSIQVHPNVIVTATAGFIRGGYTLDQVIRGWQARGAVMGVYDYFSVMPWDWDMPGRARAARPSYMAETIARFHGMNVRFHDAESSDNWGPNGLGYYVASRILWDLQEAERFDEIVDDFLQRAFGPAREALATFYRLIDGAHPPLLSQNLVGRMYRSLAEGRRLAAGDPGILGRIEDLTLYTRYVELKLNRDEFGALRHAHRIRDRGMVHFKGMWPWRESAHRVELETIPAEWLEEACYEAAEVMAMVDAGIAANPVVEFTPVAFSEDLVPATPLELPEVELGNLGHLYQGYGRQGGFNSYTWMEEPGAVTLKVTGGLIPHYRDRGHVKISLFSPQEVTLEPVAHDESVPPDGVEREVTLRTPYSGLHRLELRDGGDASRVLWQDGQPMTLPCSPEAPPPVYGTWSLYFYVPKGTPAVAGYTSSTGRLGGWRRQRGARLRRHRCARVFRCAGARGAGWASLEGGSCGWPRRTDDCAALSGPKCTGTAAAARSGGKGCAAITSTSPQTEPHHEDSSFPSCLCLAPTPAERSRCGDSTPPLRRSNARRRYLAWKGGSLLADFDAAEVPRLIPPQGSCAPLGPVVARGFKQREDGLDLGRSHARTGALGRGGSVRHAPFDHFV
jgi:hypothetical protein